MTYLLYLVSMGIGAPAQAATGGEDLLNPWQAGLLRDYEENRNKRSRAKVERSIRTASKRCDGNGPPDRSVRACLQALVLARAVGHTDADQRLEDLGTRIAATGVVPDLGTLGAGTAMHLGRRLATRAPSESEGLFRHAVDRTMANLGTTHPAVAEPLADLARIRLRAGDLTEASSLLGRATAVAGGAEPLTSRLTLEMVRLRLASPKPPFALGPLDEVLAAEDARITRQLYLGTPAERQALLEPLQATTHQAVSLHLQQLHGHTKAAELALRTLLRRKGRLVEAEYDALHAVRRESDEEGLKLIDRLLAATTRQSELASTTASSTDALQTLNAERATVAREVTELQTQLAARSELFREQAAQTSVGDVQEALQPGQALLELAVYRPWDPAENTLGPERYAAYVLRHEGAAVGKDLGPAAQIDDAVRKLRADLIGRSEVDASAQDLASAVLGPITEALAGAEHLLISPDGLLNVVPFDVLLSQTAHAEAAVSYLTTGRDVLQAGMWKGKASEPMIVSDVDFGGGTSPWTPLPGTRDEGEAIAALFPEAAHRQGTQATEEALKDVVRPTFLHVATHGFFHADRDPALFAVAASRGLEVLPLPSVPDDPVPEAWEGPSANPALDSGIVLAGANRPQDGRQDGLLTAAELSNVDLRSTRVAVLSACETGVGTLRNGDGVQGLRRSLVLSGSHAQVVSLWKVDDDATAFLMQRMYESLSSGATVVDALAAAKQATAAEQRWSHPYFWAAFTLSGAWSSVLR